MSFTFVHAADLHLDSPFRGLRAHGPLRDRLHDATFEALHRIVSLCLSERAQFLVLAGDLYDERDRSLRARLRLRDELLRLDAAGIRTFIVHGNHDPLSGDSGALRLPPSVKVFGPTWEEVPVSADGQILCRVQGVSYPRERVTEDLSRHFGRRGPEFTIGILHCNVGGALGHLNYAPCTLDDLSRRELDYWALGHVHTRAEYPLASGGLAVYPGNPQGRHVNEPGPRGCVVVSVTERRCESRFVPLEPARWHKVELDIGGLTSLDALEDRIGEAVDRACPPEDSHQAHAVRLQLVGRGPLHRELAADEAARELEDRLSETLARRSPPVLLESLRLQSRPELDLPEILEAGGLSAAVLKEVAQARENAAIRESLLSDDDWKRLDSALKKVAQPSARLAAEAMLDRAAFRALELLAGEEGET